ncbi:hypothetical protein BK816_03010 [Boudabousia tangfeifanii]|uniref:Uncharacterized protein n=1 Tax=Boudabousia tangfeifanii TaxID=1912795 RepID=A0A1D9MJ70_9ACTO|nr:hypothetical protein [Boudabousia tangfeifanii]AOZ72391.1 hypothetical protein BK816_03010 [Boudabousia tangfeifanii]
MNNKRKYYRLLAVLVLITMIAVVAIGGSVVVYGNKTLGNALILLLIAAGMVAYKYLSRAYKENRLFDEDGNVKAFKKIREESQEQTQVAKTTAQSQLSAKDLKRKAEIEQLRQQNKQTD